MAGEGHGALTADEALRWLRRHGCIIIFHEDRVIALRPTHRVSVNMDDGSRIEIRCPFGCTFGYTEAPTESLEALVEAIREEWRKEAGVVDALADAVDGFRSGSVELQLGKKIRTRFAGLADEERT